MSNDREKMTGKSFAYLNLKDKMMTDTDFLACDFRGSNLTGVDFSNSKLYRSDMTGATLDSAIVSLNCHTFKDVRLDRRQTEYLLYLIIMADIPSEIKDQLKEIITEKKIEAMDRLFQN